MVEEVFINGKSYCFESFVGTVVETHRERETRITGSGGGGYSFDGYGSTDPIKIQSESIVHKEFFLVDETGEERHYDVSAWQMPIRVGHQLQMLSAVRAKSDTPLLLGLNSRNMKQFEWLNEPITQVAKTHHAWQYPLVWVLSLVLAYAAGSWQLFFILLVPSLLFLAWKTSKIRKQIWQHLNEMAMNQAKWHEKYPQEP